MGVDAKLALGSTEGFRETGYSFCVAHCDGKVGERLTVLDEVRSCGRNEDGETKE